MKMVRQNKINFLQPEWAQNFPLYAGFSTRNGGVSRPPFHSLNLGFNTEDTLYNVEGNRSTLCRAFDVSPASLLTVRQVHGNNILVISEPNPDLGHFQAVRCLQVAEVSLACRRHHEVAVARIIAERRDLQS